MLGDRHAEVFVDIHAIVGECPVWDPDRNALYWIDVKAPALYRSDAASGATVTWRLPADIGGFALTQDGESAVVALRTGLFLLHLNSQALTTLADPPFDSRIHRFNEVDCDPAGRLWLGVMFEPEPGIQAQAQPGAIYSFTQPTGLVAHPQYALVPNGFAWSLDQRRLYIARSKERSIDAVEFDPASGRLGSSRVFASIPAELGVPDGGTVDSEDFYWTAIHGGSRLRRYARDGRLDREVSLPARNPTMMAFGGDELNELYVTSASHGSSSRPDGSLFRLRPRLRGRLRPRFRV
jgi:sugar lactone lactonase YvrE